MKFINETEAEPADEDIERILSGCVRARSRRSTRRSAPRWRRGASTG
jgi:hypothetical protein